jgi:hypoxanthine phosphoribosyltransferase
MDQALESILFDEDDIHRRVADLARQISEDYRGKDLVLIAVLKGAVYFLSDLSRHITIPHTFDFVGAASYGTNTYSSGQVTITKDVTTSLRDKHVLLIEDIYDSGRTLDVIIGLLKLHKPASVETCVFLKKNCSRLKEIDIKYYGFEFTKGFVVGYGLDYAEHYRHLPYIGILKAPTV